MRKRGSKYDVTLFLLATLLGSTVLFNRFNVIDQVALSELRSISSVCAKLVWTRQQALHLIGCVVAHAQFGDFCRCCTGSALRWRF
jgi:hypothetical protein